jgi:hypothetical protein
MEFLEDALAAIDCRDWAVWSYFGQLRYVRQLCQPIAKKSALPTSTLQKCRTVHEWQVW